MSKTKKKPAQILRSCVFCDQRPLSEEEYFPRWIRAILPDTSEPGYIMSNTDQIGTYAPRFKTVVSSRIGKFSNKTVKEFCQACNNGWMSRIEEGAKPILSSWILKRETTIQKEDRDALLKWASLRIIVMDMAERNWLINKEARQKFYRDQLPIKNLSIWIGKADVEGDYRHSVESISISSIIIPRGRPNTRSYLWIAGGLMIWALYSQNDNADFENFFGSGGGHMMSITNNDLKIDSRELTVWGLPSITFLSRSFLRLSSGEM